MVKKMNRYEVEVADDDFYFVFGKTVTDSQFVKNCERRISGLHSEIFPGLRLRNKFNNQLLKPKLQVILVPAEGR